SQQALRLLALPKHRKGENPGSCALRCAHLPKPPAEARGCPQAAPYQLADRSTILRADEAPLLEPAGNNPVSGPRRGILDFAQEFDCRLQACSRCHGKSREGSSWLLNLGPVVRLFFTPCADSWAPRGSPGRRAHGFRGARRW